MTTTFPQLKLKTLVNFPTAAIGRNGITVATSNNSYFIDIDYSKFSTAPALPAGSYMLAYNPITKAYVLAVPTGASPSDNIPFMDGTGAAGVNGLYARYDHVHPSDTSRAAVTYVDAQDALRAPLISPTFTGDPKAPTPSPGDSDTSIATTAFVTNAVSTAVGGASTGIPQNSQSADYTLVLADQEKHIFHPSADTTPRTWTIPSNASVPYIIGTVITFINQHGAGLITIAITSDAMYQAGTGSTGSRVLSPSGEATALKVTATEWLISGTGLS
jgi:hypothetical protein